MVRLHNDRLDVLRKYLLDCKLSSELYEEILDHLACEAEELMWEGEAFENIVQLFKEEAEKSTLLGLDADLKEILACDYSLTDIVFEGRNKLYGAYALRKGYHNTIQRSVVLGVTLFLFMIFLPDLYARLTPEPKADDIGFEIELDNVNIKHKSVGSFDTIINTNNFDKESDEELNSQVASTTEEFKDFKYFNKSNLPRDFHLESDLHFNEQLLELSEGKEIFNLVDQKAEFTGGMSDLLSYISFQIDYPKPAVINSVQGRVMIGFTISTDGSVKNVEVIKGIGSGCDEEAKRVISNMPKWKPGRQGGELINTRYLIPVVFEIKKN